ncbi:hypothetical protein [Streptomyces europaeiscabiei]|uniref:hypothetical protein n=1 Tax=Streptomyces europaeiscabiei TaxID=146819 RepID=UPI0029AA896E|nr:hypothetical protein [Streptomyces europaeiscabiei]MDX2757358.1 hypothetical protein [Streptomyces europaeiscabiei]
MPPGLGRAIEPEDGDRGDEYQVSGLPAPVIASGPKAAASGVKWGLLGVLRLIG